MTKQKIEKEKSKDKVKAIEQDELCQLILQAQSRCDSVLQYLIIIYDKLIHRIIQKVINLANSRYQDFYSIGQESLYRAIMTFDVAKSDNFMCYASLLISRDAKKYKISLGCHERADNKIAETITRQDEATYYEDFEGAIDIKSQLARVVIELDGLPVRQRMIIIHNMQGIEKAEICQILGISRRLYDCEFKKACEYLSDFKLSEEE